MLTKARAFAIATAIAALAYGTGGAVQAQDTSELRDRINEGTVTVIGGSIDDTMMLGELAEQFNNPGAIRILPITGAGGIQNVADILYLRGIDMAVVEADTLELIRERNLYRDIDKRLAVVAKLYNEEIHLVAHRSVRSIAELSGQRVNFGSQGTGEYERSRQIFQALGISATPVSLEARDALDKVKNGQLAATVYVAPKPSTLLKDATLGQTAHLISIPFQGAIASRYLPARIGNTDYPGLVAPGAEVKTLAVNTVLASYNWKKKNDRTEKVDNFVTTFFNNVQQMHAPRYHAKWREVSLSAELPGWQRLASAKAWVNEAVAARSRNDQLLSSDTEQILRDEFRAFLGSLERGQGQGQQAPRGAGNNAQPISAGAPQVSDDSLKDLFTNFLEWRRDQSQ